jgi:FkbM family methyltransferase
LKQVRAACSLKGPGDGLQLAVHDRHDQFISSQISETGIWEPYESELLCRSLEPGGLCLDVGANIGYFTVLAGREVGPNGRVYAFEPEPRNFDLLSYNVSLNGFAARTVLHRLALGEKPAMAQLHLHPDNLGDHQLNPGSEWPGEERVEVNVRCGASLLEEEPRSLDVVKIDTQGTELAVVRGLLPRLASDREGLRMIIELTPLSLRQAGHSGAQLLRALAELDLPFAIVDHLAHRLVPTPLDELVTWSDNVDSCHDDPGFMNIFIGTEPG